MKAYWTSPKAQFREEQNLREVTQFLFDNITTVLPIINFVAGSATRLQDQVVVPAARLATKIHESPCKFELQLPGMVTGVAKTFLLEDFRAVRSLDIKTGEVTKPNHKVRYNGEGVVGCHVLSLEPALWRVSLAKERHMLRKALCLVDFKFEVTKASRASSTRRSARMQERAAGSRDELS